MGTSYATIPLPPGYSIGQRIVTNKNYANISPRSARRRGGVIIGGSHGSSGPVVIHLDGYKRPQPFTLNLFDVVEESKPK